MRKTLLKTYFFILAAGILYFAFISLTGLSLPCPFFETTGLLCTGCGSTRMFVSLIHLDFASAFNYNPAVLCILILWIFISILLFAGKPGFIRKPQVLITLLCVTAAVLAIFGICRNF